MAKARLKNEQTEPVDLPAYRQLVPSWGQGKSKVINGQTAVYVPSPFQQYPGGVWVPYELSPAQFDAWHRAVNAQAQAEDGDTFVLHYFPERFSFFLEWDLGNVTPDMITPDGMRLPSMPLVSWLVSIGSELIMRATSFPNLPAPSI